MCLKCLENGVDKILDTDPIILTNIIYGVSIFILVVLSALFSSMETAFSAVLPSRLRSYADDGNKKAVTALKITDNYQSALTTILIGNNIVNIGCSSLGTLLCINLFGNYGAAISTGVITLLVLTFGEILPKSFAKEKSEHLCLATANLLNILMIVLKPLASVFSGFNSLLQKRIKKDSSPSVTENELKYIIESIEEEGVIEEQESELVQSALDFDDKTVEDILTPRVDVCALDINDPSDVNREKIMVERFSRFPVFEDTIDNVIGILHARDYLDAIVNGKDADICSMIQPAYFVYKTKKLSTILSEFKHKKLHIAVVVDEYGGTLGIVTMEDLLEEIVGDIWDEDEEEEKKITKLDDKTYLISGDMNIEDFAELFELNLKLFEETESNSVGGWVYENIGSIPAEGSSFNFEGIKVTIQSVKEQRIELIKAEKTENDLEEI